MLSEVKAEKVPMHIASQNLMPEAIRMAGLPKGAPDSSIVRKLLEKGLVAEAVDYLFGTTPEMARCHMKERDWRLYLALRDGQLRELLKMMIEHCHWRHSHEKDGYAIKVYPGEWLMIGYPVSEEVKKATIGW